MKKLHGKAAKKEKAKIHELKNRIAKRKRALTQVKIDLEKRHKEVETKKAELARSDNSDVNHEPEPRQQPAAPAKEKQSKKAGVEIPTIQDKLYNGDGSNANRDEQPEELKQRLKEKMHKMEEQLSQADAAHQKD